MKDSVRCMVCVAARKAPGRLMGTITPLSPKKKWGGGFWDRCWKGRDPPSPLGID